MICISNVVSCFFIDVKLRRCYKYVCLFYCTEFKVKHLPSWFQVVISADVEPKDLVNKREADGVEDSHRVLMDDLNITKNSVSRLCRVLQTHLKKTT